MIVYYCSCKTVILLNKVFFYLIWYRKRQNFLVILWLFNNFQGLLAKTGSDIHRCDINQLLPEVSSCPVAFHSQWEKFISRKYGVTSVGKVRHYKALPLTLWTPVEPMKWVKQYWRHLRCTLYVNYSELASLNFCTGAEDCNSFQSSHNQRTVATFFGESNPGIKRFSYTES